MNIALSKNIALFKKALSTVRIDVSMQLGGIILSNMNRLNYLARQRAPVIPPRYNRKIQGGFHLGLRVIWPPPPPLSLQV